MRRVVCVLCILLTLCGGGLAEPEHKIQYLSGSKVYMTELCDKLLLIDAPIQIMLTRRNEQGPHGTHCMLNVMHRQSYFMFVVTFRDMFLPPAVYGIDCRSSRLELMSGEAHVLTGDGGLCGQDTPGTYQTDSNRLAIRYRSNGQAQTKSDYYTATVTPFHLGDCADDEFECVNERCIARENMCDTFNNCGDNSDENLCPGYNAPVKAPVMAPVKATDSSPITGSTPNAGMTTGTKIKYGIFGAIVVGALLACLVCRILTLRRMKQKVDGLDTFTDK